MFSRALLLNWTEYINIELFGRRDQNLGLVNLCLSWEENSLLLCNTAFSVIPKNHFCFMNINMQFSVSILSSNSVWQCIILLWIVWKSIIWLYQITEAKLLSINLNVGKLRSINTNISLFFFALRIFEMYVAIHTYIPIWYNVRKIISLVLWVRMDYTKRLGSTSCLTLDH